MTEREKAIGYLQMLKIEGHLDETALPQLQEMYNLQKGEAEQLLEEFKLKPEYNQSITNNIKEKAVILIFCLAVGGFFLFASLSPTGSSGFSVHAIFFLLAAFGLIVYILKLSNEAFKITTNLPWIKNKALPFVVICSIAFAWFQYNVSSRKYLLLPAAWVKVDSLVIAEKIKEKHKSKSGDYYYEILIENYTTAFKWYNKQHLYCFNIAPPNKLLMKGDTVSIWLEKNTNAHLKASAYNMVFDVEKKGARFLDIEERNEAAKEEAERTRNIWGILLAISFLAFMHFKKMKI